MSASLYTVLNAIPEFAGRVYLDVAPQTPQTPYVILWNPPEGKARPYDRGSGLYNTPIAATVYTKPTTTQNTAQSTNNARLECEKLREKIMDIAPDSVDVSLAGTPYVPGSFAVQLPFSVLPDRTVAGQFFATVLFAAQTFRKPKST